MREEHSIYHSSSRLSTRVQIVHTDGMATALRGWQGFRAFLEMIKFEHSIFALPFAMVGLMWGSYFEHQTMWPGWWRFGWVVVAMVSCRSAAMAYNRIADRDIDVINERTKSRAIPAGILTLRTSNLYFLGSCILFFVSAAMLNPLALSLSPLALAITLIYSQTKRFTWACHFVLGLSLGIAPAASWIASSGHLNWAIVPVSAAVMFWTAGFDIIYSLQDETFDREQGLKSIPVKFGPVRALLISRISHVLALSLLALATVLNSGGLVAWIGVIVVGVLLAYEQSLVKPHDLSKVNLAFFTLNGFVSLGFFVFILADGLTKHP